MIIGTVGTGTIAETTNLTSWMMSGVICSVIWLVILILKSLFAPMPMAGDVAEAGAGVTITGVETTAIMEIIATMVTMAIMVGVMGPIDPIMDPIDPTMAHTGSLAFMAHRHPLPHLHMASRHDSDRRQQYLARHRLTGSPHPGLRHRG